VLVARDDSAKPMAVLLLSFFTIENLGARGENVRRTVPLESETEIFVSTAGMGGG
jgi:hypothetical protein